MKAIKKPVEIDWFRWNNNPEELGDWVDSLGDDPLEHFDYEGELQVKTLEGSSYSVPIGYIIIRGVQGEYYPCEPIIFFKTYNMAKIENYEELQIVLDRIFVLFDIAEDDPRVEELEMLCSLVEEYEDKNYPIS